MIHSIQILQTAKNKLVLERERISQTLINRIHSKETESATNIINARIEKLKHSINLLTDESLKNF